VDALPPLVPEFETVERARPCLHPLAAFRAPGRPGVSRKEAIRRRSAFPAILPLLLLAACSREAPAPSAPAMPVLADESSERECACVERGECAVPEAVPADDEGQSERRGYQCRPDDRAGASATCTYESRLRINPRTPWLPWARTTLRFRHLGERGWCLTERRSDRTL
jgi:hypothetical protein